MKKWESIEELQNWLNECNCIADFCRKLEIVPRGDSYRIVKNLISKYNLSTKHFLGSEKYRVKNPGKTVLLSEILETGKQSNATRLKERLFRWGVKEKKCECCGNTEWMGVELPLEIHHIDGNHQNNHLENLQILCPNCHALTNTFRGKNIEILKDTIIAEDIKQTIEKLKEKERLRQEEIEANRYIPKNHKRLRKIRYCKICGKELKRHNKDYCSLICAGKALRKNEYDKDTLLEQSKTVRSLIQLAKLYSITDNAMKKHLKRLGIFEQCKQNFLPIAKTILQLDLNDNFIKEWSSALEASKALKIPKGNILACCIGKRSYTHEYKFKYKEI